MEMPREQTVEVWGETHTISVYQKSKNMWVAVGEYMGQRIEITDRSPTAAAKLWTETARYRGN